MTPQHQINVINILHLFIYILRKDIFNLCFCSSQCCYNGLCHAVQFNSRLREWKIENWVNFIKLYFCWWDKLITHILGLFSYFPRCFIENWQVSISICALDFLRAGRLWAPSEMFLVLGRALELYAFSLYLICAMTLLVHLQLLMKHVMS